MGREQHGLRNTQAVFLPSLGRAPHLPHAVELRNSLEAKVGCDLPTTLVFDYPTIAALAGYLATAVGQPQSGAAAATADSSDSEEGSDDEPAAAAAAPARRRAASRHRRSRSSKSRAPAAASAAAPASVEAHQAAMLGLVQEAVAAVLGSADIDPQQPLMAAGLDSLSSVELRNSLEAKVGAELPTTLVFDYPTMAALAGFLATAVQPGAAAAGEASEAASSDASGSESEEAERAAVVASRRRRSTPRRRAAAPAGQPAAVSAEAHQALMLQAVQEAVAAVLGSADIDPQQPLMAAGLDSLSSGGAGWARSALLSCDDAAAVPLCSAALDGVQAAC